MNIQSGRGGVRRNPASADPSRQVKNSRLRPAFVIILMVFVITALCQVHIHLKSRITGVSRNIDSVRHDIHNVNLEINSLRNRIEERNSWHYISRQINRFGLKLKRPAHGQMHTVSMLTAHTAHLAALNIEKQAAMRTASVSETVENRKTTSRGASGVTGRNYLFR